MFKSILNAQNCKKYRNVQAKYRAVQPTGRRTVAARQLKRLQPAQKLEGRNPSLIASGNIFQKIIKIEKENEVLNL